MFRARGCQIGGLGVDKVRPNSYIVTAASRRPEKEESSRSKSEKGASFFLRIRREFSSAGNQDRAEQKA
jgi:hypothetical protein